MNESSKNSVRDIATYTSIRLSVVKEVSATRSCSTEGKLSRNRMHETRHWHNFYEKRISEATVSSMGMYFNRKLVKCTFKKIYF